MGGTGIWGGGGLTGVWIRRRGLGVFGRRRTRRGIFRGFLSKRGRGTLVEMNAPNSLKL